MTSFLLSFCLFWTSYSVKYDYNYSSGIGPNYWSSIFEVECGENRQSPINVNTTDDITYIQEETSCEAGYFADFDLNHTSFKLSNSGHGFKLAAVDSSGYLLNTNETAIARLRNVVYDEHPEYCFDSVHFHFGPNVSHGSEHHLNGVQYPIEAHFVFFSCIYETIGDAVVAHNTGTDDDTEILAVLGIFFEVGNANDAFADITPHVDNIIWTGNSTNITADFSGFFGGKAALRNMVETVYMYEGSLTTPLCFKAVLWHVSTKVLKISQAQLNTLYQIRHNDSNYNTFSTFGNYRPLQDRGTRQMWTMDCEEQDNTPNIFNAGFILCFAFIFSLMM